MLLQSTVATVVAAVAAAVPVALVRFASTVVPLKPCRTDRHGLTNTDDLCLDASKLIYLGSSGGFVVGKKERRTNTQTHENGYLGSLCDLFVGRTDRQTDRQTD